LMIVLATGAGALVVPFSAIAHGPGHLAGYWVFWLLVFSGAGYALGLYRTRRRPKGWRIAAFIAGWSLLALALFGPMEQWAHSTVAGHMTQHMLLLAVVPPLLLLARPLPQYLQALPVNTRRKAGPWAARIYTAAGNTPVLAFLFHGLVIWLWHMPGPLQLSVEHRLLHDGVHLLFLATGLWFWWSLMAPVRLGRKGFGPALLFAVLTLMHTGMLGALLTFAPQLLYPEHPAGFAGFSRLSDQQLAGLIMWVPGGLVYTAAAVVLGAVWLRETERLLPSDSE